MHVRARKDDLSRIPTLPGGGRLLHPINATYRYQGVVKLQKLQSRAPTLSKLGKKHAANRARQTKMKVHACIPSVSLPVSQSCNELFVCTHSRVVKHF